jgi:hypothetical protein
MSDAVAVVGSAEIDYGVIDSSKIGLVQILITEGAAASDTIPTKYKTATPTKTEGIAVKDSLSKYKNAYKTFTEGLATKDTVTKFKLVVKTIIEYMGVGDYLEEIYNKIVLNHAKYDTPAVRVQNNSR